MALTIYLKERRPLVTDKSLFSSQSVHKVPHFVIDIRRISDGLRNFRPENLTIPLAQSMHGNLHRTFGHSELRSRLAACWSLADQAFL